MRNEGLIRNETFAKLYVKINKISGINAGDFDLNKGMSLKEIFKELSSDDVYIKGESVTLTFLPGQTFKDYINTISDNLNVATIENGIIKAIDIGNTTIKIKSNDIILEIFVEVR